MCCLVYTRLWIYRYFALLLVPLFVNNGFWLNSNINMTTSENSIHSINPTVSQENSSLHPSLPPCTVRVQGKGNQKEAMYSWGLSLGSSSLQEEEKKGTTCNSPWIITQTLLCSHSAVVVNTWYVHYLTSMSFPPLTPCPTEKTVHGGPAVYDAAPDLQVESYYC